MKRNGHIRGKVLVTPDGGDTETYRSLASVPTSRSRRDFKYIGGYYRVRCTGGRADRCKHMYYRWRTAGERRACRKRAFRQENNA